MRGHFLRAAAGRRVSGGGGYTPTDADAAAYISAIEAADGEALEDGVREAIDEFVIGCKADGIWSAIKACCIMAGARTLAGALTPLVGPAPTNNNFAAEDYSRTAGLTGNALDKNLDTNRNNNADPQDSKHLALWFSSVATAGAQMGMGTIEAGASQLFIRPDFTLVRHNVFGADANTINSNLDSSIAKISGPGFAGASRANSSNVDYRLNGTTYNRSQVSAAPLSGTIKVFSRDGNYSDGTISFYSIGEHLNLALLDTRVSTLMTDISAALT